MTADIDLLPLPEWAYGNNHLRIKAAGLQSRVTDYARANVAHATAAKDAEIERLRAEREVIGAEAVKYAGKSGRLEARAERLADALRIAFRHLDVGSMQVSHKKDIAAIVAALRDQGGDNGSQEQSE